MAQIIKEVRIDVSQPNVFQAIVAKQLDCNSRFLKVTLVDFGVKIDVPNTAEVAINANRPDGESQSFKGVANDDGTFTVPLAQWMLEVAGTVKCDVSVINIEDGKRLTSTDFWLDVQAAANPNSDISINPDGEIRVITPVRIIDESSTDDQYPSAKAVYDHTEVTKSASGKVITIDSANAPLQSLKLYGSTTQNGTPTPDAPIPIVSVGDSGSFEVGVFGKNLLENKQGTQAGQGVTFTYNNEDKSYTLSGTCTGNILQNIGKAYLVKGTSYTVTGCASGGATNTYLIRVTDSKNTILAQDIGDGETFTATETGYHTIGIRVQGGTVTDGLTFYPMVRYATETDGTYQPCNKQTLTMPYTLPSFNEYKDEIDFARGVRIQKVIKATDFKLTATYTNTDLYVCNAGVSLIGGSNNMAICNVMTNYAYHAQDNVHFYVNANGNINVYVPKGYDIASKPIEVIAVLQTPIETPLTETELNAYRQLMTNSGTTNIASEADMELEYYTPNGQALGNIHSQVNKDYIKLQQAIISTGGSTL